MSNKCAAGSNNRGIVLFVVILIIFIVSILAAVGLQVMRSNSRHSYHSASRIKAYYSLYAAMVFTFEQLRLGLWAPNPNIAYSYSFCSPSDPGGPCTYNDVDIAYRVNITVSDLATSGMGGVRRVTLISNYTYSP